MADADEQAGTNGTANSNHLCMVRSDVSLRRYSLESAYVCEAISIRTGLGIMGAFYLLAAVQLGQHDYDSVGVRFRGSREGRRHKDLSV